MYNQLRYLAYLFDVEKAAKAATGKRHGAIAFLSHPIYHPFIVIER